MIQLGQQGHLHTKTVKLEKVTRNRTALDIKSRFVIIYEKALVYESEQEEKILKSSKSTAKSRDTRVGKHTGLVGVRGMFFRNRRDTQVL